MHTPTAETRAQVVEDSKLGVPKAAVAKSLGISLPTLYKHYREEIEAGVTVANRQVAGKLYELAMSGNVSALIFWLKVRARWSTVHDDPDQDREDVKDPDPDV